MDHDRLFKELLSTFFVEFVDLFLPDVGTYLDRDSAVVAIDKEVFTDVTSGEKHEVDLLVNLHICRRRRKQRLWQWYQPGKARAY